MKTRVWSVALGLMVGLGGVAAAVAAEEQTVHAGALAMKVPKAWQAERPSNSMRKAQMKVPSATGDSGPAELTVSPIAGGGSMEANIKRWEGQFEGEDGRPAKAKTETKKGKTLEYTRVEIAGSYKGMAMPGQPAGEAKGGYRLIGAIVTTPELNYYIRLTGPDKTVAGNSKEIDAMLDSLSVDQ